MPVLMNKGDDPRQAAWLFYTARPVLDELGQAIQQGRFDAGRLHVDEQEVLGAKKASSEVTVFLDVTSVVPDDFDLAGALERAQEKAEKGAGDADPQADEAEGEGEADPASAGESETEAEAGDGAACGDAPHDADDAPAGPQLPYEPVALDEPIRVTIGTTTAQAARTFFVPREDDEDDATRTAVVDLPGLQALAQLIAAMRDSSVGIPAQAVWHVDAQGILRMAPAKALKPMAGNVLKAKL